MIKHLVSAEDLDRDILEKLFDTTDSIKNNPKEYGACLDGKIVATIFFEPSTRTRLSFEAAALRLGARLISTENARDNSSGTKGESLEDTVTILAGYADAIVMRHYEDDSAMRAAKASLVPVINAGSGRQEHPTQAILDLYTLRECKGTIDGVSVAIMGDLLHGRTTHSLIKLLARYKNTKVYGYSVKGLGLPEGYTRFLAKAGVEYIVCKSFDEIPCNVGAIYQTRVQRERLADKSMSIDEFRIDAKAMSRMSKNTIVMHPLPRVDEISVDVDSDDRSVFFRQAHNGMYTRMALLKMMIGE